MAALSEQILEAAGRRPEGSLLAAKPFLALGNRDAEHQALRRLAARGKLFEITRGRYALPVRSRFGTRPPATEAVITQLNQEGAKMVVSSGAAAANALGLPTVTGVLMDTLPDVKEYPLIGWQRCFYMPSLPIEGYARMV
jgi:hypothetical protein